uniref:Putative secreted protein n=1 Tax=Anopheles marajoara TaxID=58244 RepID=A0A2M4CD84_9DIPT
MMMMMMMITMSVAIGFEWCWCWIRAATNEHGGEGLIHLFSVTRSASRFCLLQQQLLGVVAVVCTDQPYNDCSS